jgi:hypothetical protein
MVSMVQCETHSPPPLAEVQLQRRAATMGLDIRDVDDAISVQVLASQWAVGARCPALLTGVLESG